MHAQNVHAHNVLNKPKPKKYVKRCVWCQTVVGRVVEEEEEKRTRVGNAVGRQVGREGKGAWQGRNAGRQAGSVWW